MIFIIICKDRPDSAELRAQTRPRHLDYMKDAGARLKMAGPIQSEDGQTPIGSVIIIEAGSETAARLFAENDPYHSAGLFQSVEIRPFKPVLGHWMED